MTIEQAVIESTHAFTGPGAYTVERDQDGDCVVCPSDEETLAVQEYADGYPWTEFSVAADEVAP